LSNCGFRPGPDAETPPADLCLTDDEEYGELGV
jgi:hypothetical protein